MLRSSDRTDLPSGVAQRLSLLRALIPLVLTFTISANAHALIGALLLKKCFSVIGNLVLRSPSDNPYALEFPAERKGNITPQAKAFLESLEWQKLNRVEGGRAIKVRLGQKTFHHKGREIELNFAYLDTGEIRLGIRSLAGISDIEGLIRKTARQFGPNLSRYEHNVHQYNAKTPEQHGEVLQLGEELARLLHSLEKQDSP